MNIYFAVLALLADGPKSGLWLGEELAAGTSGMHALNGYQVYPALAQLERAGLVWNPAAAAGRTIRGKNSGSPPMGGGSWPDGCARRRLRAQPGDELVLKIQLAGQVPGTDVHEVIQAHRRHLVELMQQRTRARPEAGTEAAAR